MGSLLPCFKAYDVRGKVPGELNADIAEAIGRAYADQTGAHKVCIGYDIRLSGPELCDALTRGLNAAGVEVIRLGMVGTEMVYFATAHYGFDGGMMITASHNPPEYNGIKMVRQESRPISSDTGLGDIERRAFERKWERTGQGGTRDLDCYEDFIRHLLDVVKPGELKPLKVLCDAGNGAAGRSLEKLLPHLPLRVTPRLFEPDGRFPNGVPNPILEASRAGTQKAMAGGDFDFGVAWDGDYDRCFFFDGHGAFIEGYYIVGLLAHAILAAHPGA
ncbi:MAG: phosphomannomutase, partial [Fimbriimonas ginsengisoli]|nr:phosphomannomutase [Fimbriimonas ginsengisoli]